ncbi:hypothetical protein [Aquibacillus saliphilus]|uniref:hypothetical protein n=1 Tax=Aquibacillus saliphilus TaxID=1909422 RepID=UPI001CF04892|nr:hypothetical protein [Aquibacillus saliphilus]
MLESRKERRLEARQNGTEFVPQYNSGVRFDGKGKEIKVGGNPKTYKEMLGVGYERFNNKFVQFKDSKKGVKVTFS